MAYNLGYQDPPPHWFMGHRIESLNLDLMNALPLPCLLYTSMRHLALSYGVEAIYMPELANGQEYYFAAPVSYTHLP